VSEQFSPGNPNMNPLPDPQLIEMLAGMNASADMAVVQRTRRAVMEAASELREQRKRNRRNAAVVILAVTALGMVLTPALWSSVDDFLGGEQLFELPGMIMALILMLFSTILCVLVVGLRNQQHIRPGRR
jgi:cytochrome bd-type quinol oxidase subunit 2